MKLNGVKIVDTFAEAFPMVATRLIVTAIDSYWAECAVRSMTGFATSVIACGCEAGIERPVKSADSPDGRPGFSVLMFAMGKKGLVDQITKRVGQTIMTTPTSACYAGLHTDNMVPLGKNLRYFGDGFQISKRVNGRRYWRVPVMHGEFVCEETCGVQPAVGGGNFLVLAETPKQAVAACKRAVTAIDKLPNSITPFPGGVVGSGSKVGSKYNFLPASSNEKFCPTLKGLVTDSELSEEVGSVAEVVIDGLDADAVAAATRVGVRAACGLGRRGGIVAVSAGNYGGKLGPHHFHLRKLLK